MVNLRDLYYIAGNAEKYYWASTGAALGFGAGQYFMGRGSSGLRLGSRMVSFGVRAHANAIRAVSSTKFVRGGSTTIGSLAASAMVGYVLGSAIGTGVSHVAFGDRGRDLAVDLYLPGGASFIEEGILGAPSNLKRVVSHYL